MLKLIVVLIIILFFIWFIYSRTTAKEPFSSSKINIIQTWKTNQIAPKYQSLVYKIKSRM